MPSFKQKSLTLLVLAALLLLCGCSAFRAAPSPSAIPMMEDPLPSASAAPTPEIGTAAQTRRIDAIAEITNEKHSFMPNGQPLMHILSGGDLRASAWMLDVAAAAIDTTIPASEQAVIKTEAAGQATLSACTLASSADILPLMYCLGDAVLSDTMAVQTGKNTEILSVADSGKLQVIRCDLLTSGTGSSCLAAAQGGQMDCMAGTRLTVMSEDALAIRLSDGGTITVTDGAVHGDIAFSGYGNALHCTNTELIGSLRFDMAEDEIDLRLQSGSRLIGTTDGDGAIGIRISLDMTSSWTLTENAYVAALLDADTTLSNIDSRGFSLYYNAESEENLWLEGKTRALNGGGYLIPLI